MEKSSMCVCVCVRTHACMHIQHAHVHTHACRHLQRLEVADPIELELQALGSCKPLNMGAGAHSLPLIYLSSPEKPIFLRNSASVSSANISQYSLYSKHPREFQGFVGAL